MTQTADVVICGAGIVGIATAHALAVQHGVRNVVLVDERAPLTLTSDKSTEAYRNWWPGPDDAMVRFMNRSIDLLEEWAVASNDRFLMNRRGYLYATADAATAARYVRDAQRAEAQGAGPLRIYRTAAEARHYRPSRASGYVDHPEGADLFLDREAIRTHFPFLNENVVAVLHARRCGWFSGQQLGMYLLEGARDAGARLMTGRLAEVDVREGEVQGVTVVLPSGASERIETSVFVNAAGPFAREVAALVGVDLPLFSELHIKAAFEDTLGVVDRNTGLVILDDPQSLSWSAEERDELAADDTTRWLTDVMPAGIHLRPEGYGNSQTVLMLWDYHSHERYASPVLPLPDDPFYPEVVLRGMTALAPRLSAYLDRLPHMYVDGGYYTKTVENRPLIGALPVTGAFVNAGFSGFGLMAAPAAAELLARQIVDGASPTTTSGIAGPECARAFALARYADPSYQAQLADWGTTGQL